MTTASLFSLSLQVDCRVSSVSFHPCGLTSRFKSTALFEPFLFLLFHLTFQVDYRVSPSFDFCGFTARLAASELSTVVSQTIANYQDNRQGMRAAESTIPYRQNMLFSPQFITGSDTTRGIRRFSFTLVVSNELSNQIIHWKCMKIDRIFVVVFVVCHV